MSSLWSLTGVLASNKGKKNKARNQSNGLLGTGTSSNSDKEASHTSLSQNDRTEDLEASLPEEVRDDQRVSLGKLSMPKTDAQITHDAIEIEMISLKEANEGLVAKNAELQLKLDSRGATAEIERDAEISHLREQKDHFEGLYNNLLGKVATIRSTLGEKLKADAVRSSQNCLFDFPDRN